MPRQVRRMKTLGQILLQNDWITEQQLAKAIQRQEQLGGRLGTSLLEVEALSEDLLLRVLADQLGVPAADIDDLRGLSEEVSSLLPANMAVRSEAVPFRIVGGHVDVAMLQVRDLGLQDELSFIIGKPVRVHIANEARIFEALEKYYGKPCPVRFRHLVDRLNRERDEWKKKPAAAAASAPPKAARAAPQPPPVAAVAPEPELDHVGSRRKLTAPPPPVTQRKIPLSAAERAALGSDLAAAPAEAEAAETDLLQEHAIAALERAVTPDEAGRALLAALSQQFVRTMLFRVTRGHLEGWMSRVPGIDNGGFEAFSTPLSLPSVFQNLGRTSGLVIGPLPAGPPHDAILALWNGDPEIECLLCPVTIRGKLAAVIYGDRDSLGVTGVDLAKVRALARSTSTALERCILRRKQGAV